MPRRQVRHDQRSRSRLEGRGDGSGVSGHLHRDVVISIPLTLIGESATINATGLAGAPAGAIEGQAPFNGITIESSHVTVEGFTVEAAEGEGILAVNPNPVPGDGRRDATVNWRPDHGCEDSPQRCDG
jgi:hypothetical protein